MDPLEAQQIKKLRFSMYIWCASDGFCGITGIYKQAEFRIQKSCLYEYGYYYSVCAVSNSGWIESVHMSLLMDNDISTDLVGQKFSNFSYDFYIFFRNL